MGVLPLEFPAGQNADSLGLTGREVFTIAGVASVAPGGSVPVIARGDGGETRFEARCRIDTPTELHYFLSGGILPAVMRKMLAS
jgi:aconitate hydratase